MAIEKAVGFVLNVRQVRESSQGVTFYTEEFGKLRGILKGSRLLGSKYGSSILPASLNSIVFYHRRGKELHLITQCDLINGYDGIRKYINKIAYAGYFLELTDQMSFPQDFNRQIFNLLQQAFDYLEMSKDVEKVGRAFEVKLIKYSGLMPRLSACVFCSKKPEVQGYFSSLHGGVLCKRCIIRDRQAFVVSAGALRSIEELARLRFDNLARIKLIPAILKELKRLLGEFLEFHLEKRLNSVRFFKKLETMPYWKG